MLSRSAMTLRIEAGDRVIGRSWESVREPTGSPDVRKASTRWRKMSRCRSSRIPALGLDGFIPKSLNRLYYSQAGRARFASAVAGAAR